MDIKDENNCDILIIGSGLAGLLLAQKTSKLGKIVILTKTTIDECSTKIAQAGIASVFSDIDSFNSHINDTITAGDGLCHNTVVDKIVKSGPDRITELQELGVPFSKNNSGEFDLGLEAAHSHRRVIHCKDITGEQLHHTLKSNVSNSPNIEILENHIAINLKIKEGKCVGVYALDKIKGIIKNFSAKITVLATGGIGKAFLYTSNPDIASGDGIAMAYRAGATIMNMEFVQFHPTILFHPFTKSFLISEALRGEGAILLDANGKSFMENYDPRKELAPRDVVARAIDSEIKKSGVDHLSLDISFKDSDFIIKRFPGIYDKCLKLGIDMTKDPIPIVPGAHYAIGGVKATVSGKTNVKNLLAIGECACTGFHGANRLASNSLLECIVMAHYASKECRTIIDKSIQSFSQWHAGDALDSDESIVINHNWNEIRQLMTNYVGIVRSDKRLQRATHRIRLLRDEVDQYYWDFKITSDLVELRNLVDISQMIIDSALHRKESRGAHYNVNYPHRRKTVKDTLIRKSVMSDVI